MLSKICHLLRKHRMIFLRGNIKRFSEDLPQKISVKSISYTFYILKKWKYIFKGKRKMFFPRIGPNILVKSNTVYNSCKLYSVLFLITILILLLFYLHFIVGCFRWSALSFIKYTKTILLNHWNCAFTVSFLQTFNDRIDILKNRSKKSTFLSMPHFISFYSAVKYMCTVIYICIKYEIT